MQTNELEKERKVLVKHEINKMYSDAAVLTILSSRRNSKTRVRFSMP
jgi:hypothetical protein